MALKEKINTAKDVLSDTRSRMVVILLVIIVIVVLGIAFIKFKRSQLPPAGMGSAMAGAPNIVSIPGMGQPTREYAKLQEQQNIELAAEAARKGTSAMPTVVRTTYLDIGVSTDLTKQAGAASVAGCGVEDLKRARTAGVKPAELRCLGCSLAALKAAGYDAAELRDAGYGAQELKDAGFDANALKNAGFSAKDLAAAGFDAKGLAAAGFDVGELKNAGFSATDLQAAGFSADAIQAATGECDIKKLQAARSQGTSAAALKKLGCSAAALRAAGYTAEELKAAGFSAGELRAAGFSAEELKKAGYNAAELKQAGFNAAELTAAGFSPDELKAAGYTSGDLVRAGVVVGVSEAETSSCSVASLQKARKAGVSLADLRKRGCSESVLKAAGFSAKELQIAPDKGACSIENIKKARAVGVNATQLLKMGCSASDLKAAGFSEQDLNLQIAGFSEKDLKNKGFSDKEISAISKVTEEPSLQEKMSAEQLANMSDVEIDNFIKQQQAMMMVQAGQLFAAWTPVPSQLYVQGEAPAVQNAPVLTKEQEEAAALKNSDVYKAGTVIFAVLDTEVNSDETSPVMATVIQGPLKGAKVIGNFQRVTSKVLLQFSVLSVPKLNSSISINAVAIDPNTAKTALASNVDNHYMLRYGTLFASSFVSGLGQAFQTAGGQTSVSNVGTTTTMPALTFAQKALVALGNVGQQFGSAMQSKVNMPPTVKVNAGTSIGLLLMADLAVPKDRLQGSGKQ